MSEEKKTVKPINRLPGIILLLVIIVIAWNACSGNTETSSSPSTSRGEEVIRLKDGTTVNRFLGQVMCEDRIKNRLVSPGSAKFGRPTWVRTGNRWKITSTVDSQNSFGALLRTEWDCIIDGDADTVELFQVR